MASSHKLQKQRGISSVLGQTRRLAWYWELLFAAPSPKVDPQGEVTNLPVALFLSKSAHQNLIDHSVRLSLDVAPAQSNEQFLEWSGAAHKISNEKLITHNYFFVEHVSHRISG
jgi:hypothetical protein